MGAGVVIQAKQGCVYIEAGVSLGTGVLIVGHGHVGKDACIGPSSTLVNPAIAPNTIVPSCSLIESASSAASSANNRQASPPTTSFQAPDLNGNGASDPVPSMPMPPRTTSTIQPQAVSPKAVHVPDVELEPPPPAEPASAAIATPNTPVYGRAHLNSLLSALFPHRQPLNGDSNNGSNGSNQAKKDFWDDE